MLSASTPSASSNSIVVATICSYEFVDGMKDLSKPLRIDLLPVTETAFAGTGVGSAFSTDYTPVVFSALPDGTRCVYIGMRCAPRIG